MVNFWQRIEQDGGTDYIITLANYLSTTGESQQGRVVLEYIAENISKETGKQIMTIAEQIRQEGYLMGMAKGEAAILTSVRHKKEINY